MTGSPPRAPSDDARRLDRIAAALQQAAVELGGVPKLRHAHMLVQAGLEAGGGATSAVSYAVEHWESLEVRQFSTGRPGRGMIHDTIGEPRLTDKGRATLDRIVASLNGETPHG